MKRDMGVMGVGAKIAVALLAALVPLLVLSYLLSPLRLPAGAYPALYWVGGALAAVGFSLNLVAAFTMLRAHKDHSLATKGIYRVFRDPMYVLQLFLTLPGLLLMTHSWAALLAVPVAYVAYRRFVRQEHDWLRQQFGEQYNAYEKQLTIKL